MKCVELEPLLARQSVSRTGCVEGVEGVGDAEGAEGPRLFRARTDDGHVVELVDATPPHERSWRRVFGLSTLVGCPVRCTVCDAGGEYRGRLTAAELAEQLDALVRVSVPEGLSSLKAVRVELTRMGEPSFNDGVLHFLARLPADLGAAGVATSALLSSVGPAGVDEFFERLIVVKQRFYARGALTLQWSLYTTDEVARRRVVPVRCMDFARLAQLGERLARAGSAVEPRGSSGADGDPRVLLHFPLVAGLPIDAAALASRFDPAHFRVKLSGLTPTRAVARSGYDAVREEQAGAKTELRAALVAAGFEVIETETSTSDDPAACGRYFSTGLGAPEPRRALERG